MNNDWFTHNTDLDALLELDAEAREARLADLTLSDPGKAQALRRSLLLIDRSQGLLERLPETAPSGTGPWQALERVAQGGMGEVWRGQRADGAFERVVALKFLRADRSTLSSSIARERALLARLHHPGIAQLLDGGVAADGRPWLVMEWVDGQRLDQWIASEARSVRVIVDMVRRIAQAVAYAHAHLIVHRDLKPANVMIDRSGAPRLLDFGIARLMAEDRDATMTQDGALTPAFAAPEQLAGAIVDTRTDVYALGGLLYYMLTGRTVHAAEGIALAAIVQRICEQDAEPPSRNARLTEIDADLDAVVLTALAREPARRYVSADALAKDLSHWLAGEEVSARLPSRFERLRRGIRRHPIEFGLTAALFIALLGGAIATAWQARKAEAALALAERARDSALIETDRSEHLIDSFASLFREVEGEEKLSASEWLDRAANLKESPNAADASARLRFLNKLAAIEQDRGQHRRSAALLERVLAAPSDTLSISERAEATCRLAGAYHMAGRNDEAIKTFDQGIALAQRLEGVQRTVLVDCLSSRANISLLSGSVDAGAFAAIERALSELEALSATGDLRWRRASVLYTYAALYDLSGDSAQAAARYNEVRALDRELGNERTMDHATLLATLAGVLDQAGDPRTADQRYSEALAIGEATNARHPILASNYANQARVKVQLEDADGAAALALRALETLKILGDVNPVAAANAGLALANARRLQGRFDEANAALDEAERLFLIGNRDGGLVYRAMISRSLLWLARGDPQGARRALEPAIDWYSKQQRREGLIGAYAALSRIERAAQRPEQALSAAQQSLEIAREVAPNNALTIARAELEVAHSLAISASPQNAVPVAERAYPVLKRLLGENHRSTADARALAGL